MGVAVREMVVRCPWPDELADLVNRARHPGWTFEIDDGDHGDGTDGPRLLILVTHFDSYHPERKRHTGFVYPIPAATFDRASWQRWLFDRCLDVHRHETGEMLSFEYRRPVGGGESVTVRERPFAPFHGPGRDPNRNIEVGVDPMEARVRQDGGRYPGWWWNGTVVHSDERHDAGCVALGKGHSCTPVQKVDP